MCLAINDRDDQIGEAWELNCGEGELDLEARLDAAVDEVVNHVTSVTA